MVREKCNLKLVHFNLWVFVYGPSSAMLTYPIGEGNETGLKELYFVTKNVDGGNTHFISCLPTAIPEFFLKPE